MMIAVLLSLINMHKLQLILPGLQIEIGVRVNKVDQVLIEGHYLSKLSLWHHNAIMSEFMNIARPVFESEEPSQTRFAVGEISLVPLDVVGQLLRQLLPMNETHGEADGILQCHFASATRALTVHHARHRALQTSCYVKVTRGLNIPRGAEEVTVRIWRLLCDVDVWLGTGAAVVNSCGVRCPLGLPETEIGEELGCSFEVWVLVMDVGEAVNSDFRHFEDLV
jgi:hypothetical protein